MRRIIYIIVGIVVITWLILESSALTVGIVPQATCQSNTITIVLAFTNATKGGSQTLLYNTTATLRTQTLVISNFTGSSCSTNAISDGITTLQVQSGPRHIIYNASNGASPTTLNNVTINNPARPATTQDLVAGQSVTDPYSGDIYTDASSTKLNEHIVVVPSTAVQYVNDTALNYTIQVNATKNIGFTANVTCPENYKNATIYGTIYVNCGVPHFNETVHLGFGENFTDNGLTVYAPPLNLTTLFANTTVEQQVAQQSMLNYCANSTDVNGYLICYRLKGYNESLATFGVYFSVYNSTPDQSVIQSVLQALQEENSTSLSWRSSYFFEESAYVNKTKADNITIAALQSQLNDTAIQTNSYVIAGSLVGGTFCISVLILIGVGLRAKKTLAGAH